MPGQRVQAVVSIKLAVLTRIQHVKAGYPERNCACEQQDARIQRATNGNPCRGGSDPQSESQNDMRPSRETLGVGIKEDDSESYRRKNQAQSVEHCRRDDEYGT